MQLLYAQIGRRKIKLRKKSNKGDEEQSGTNQNKLTADDTLVGKMKQHLRTRTEKPFGLDPSVFDFS